MFDAQMIVRPRDLRQPRTVHLPASLRRVKIMAAPIRIKGSTAVPAKHVLQGPERRRRAFLRDQKGRKNSARRIVQRDDQIARRLAAEPFVL